jgi:hypothetical protein
MTGRRVMTEKRTARFTLLVVVVAVGAALCGCAGGPPATVGARAGTSAAPTPAAKGPSMQMEEVQSADRPSASALMVCSKEIRDDVATLLDLRRSPTTTTRWADHVYTCTYHLRQGPLMLSVREDGDVSAARAYFNGLRARLGTTHTLSAAQGLGLPAYETDDGSTVFLKDNKTLHVDASHLASPLGSSRRTPADLAYTIATDIMGCWAGD